MPHIPNTDFEVVREGGSATSHWATFRSGDGLEVRVALDERLEVASLTIEASGAPLTARRLRGLPLGDLRDRTAARQRAAIDLIRQGTSRRRRLPVKPTRDRSGRRGRSDAFYAGIILQYLGCLAREPKRCMQALGERTGFDVAQLQGFKAKAAERGLYERPGARGHPGGRITAKGQAALRFATPEDLGYSQEQIDWHADFTERCARRQAGGEHLWKLNWEELTADEPSFDARGRLVE